MDNIRINAQLCATSGALFLGVCGSMGAYILKFIDPKVSPMGHGLTLGFWAPAGVAVWFVANKIEEKNGFANAALALAGGYFVSWGVANAMGCSVSIIGPFIGLTALSITAMIIGTVVIPIIGFSAIVAAAAMLGISSGNK